MPARSYYLRSFGCQMNDHDAGRIRALLEADGLTRVSRPEQADVIVYNTCTVRRSADERFFGHLGTAVRLKRDDPRRRIVVCGCLPQVAGRAFLDQNPAVDAVVGPDNLSRLLEVIGEGGPRACLLDRSDVFSADLPARRERPHAAWVQVMSGCDNACSYCIVPAARGAARSRTPADVVAEVRRLVADGVVEVTLLGQNVNAYGGEGPAETGAGRFAELLAAVDGVEGLRRLRFTTSHPKDLDDDIVAAMASLPTVCEHLHLPAQSGSDAMLRAMERGYTMRWYLDRVEAVRAAIPDIAITTDLMVGFPGETEADFESTLALVERAGFDAAFTFVYSPRPGTPAARLRDAVPADVARRRIQTLVAATQTQSLRRRSALVGTVVEVLVDGASRRGDTLRGRSRQNVTVDLSGRTAIGSTVPVEVMAASSTSLRGNVRE